MAKRSRDVLATHNLNSPPQADPKWKARFFSIWTGQQLSLVGSRVAQFALIWWLTDLTGSATVLATASMAALVPEILLGPIAGAYVDRWSRRAAMLVADALIALASLALAYLFWIDAAQIWHIYTIMFVRAVAGSFHWPAMQASTSLMVPRRHLTRVAGLNQTMNGVLSVVGPPLGALLLELLPPQGVMLTDVGTALLAIGPLLFVRVPRPQRSGLAEGEGQGGIWVDVREGLRYIGEWPGLLALIAVAMVIKIALTPAFSLLPLLVRDHFGGGAAQLSLVEAVIGMGAIAGGLLLSGWGGFRRKIHTTLTGTTVLGISFVILGSTPSGWLWLGLACVFLAGLVIPLVDGPIMAILQSSVAPGIQGRVFMLMGSLLWLTSPLGLAFAGPVGDWLGLQVWYLAAGILCAVTGLIGFGIPVIAGIEDNNKRAMPDAQASDPGLACAAPAQPVE
ncbi:MAG: MFS transporter [Anaerolineae bacterium]